MREYPDLGPMERKPDWSVPPNPRSAPPNPRSTPPNPRSVPPGQRSAPGQEPLWRRAAAQPVARPPRPPQYEPERAPVSGPSRAPRLDAPPRLATYEDEDDQKYHLRDFDTGLATLAPKRRANPEVFPPTRQSRAPGAGLLRASGYALFSALLGGAPGIVLGLVVALLALIQLARFERRARTWRAKSPEKGREAREAREARLPAKATSERLRLLTALWQGLGAAALGAIAVLLLLTAMN